MDSFSISGLFLSAFLSSTLLPGGSEAVLIWLHQQQTHNIWWLLLIATSGNTLGGMVTWGMGRWASQRWQHHRPSLRSQQWIERYGAGALLLSWLPVIGDGLCLAAGWFRIHWLTALLLIAAGKALRYGALLSFSSAL